MKWLQIANLHFGYGGHEGELWRRNLIPFLKDYDSIDFILISGDNMYCNNGAECYEYILELAKVCNCPKENIFICPGNHDICLEKRDLVLFEFVGDKRQYEALATWGYQKFNDFYKKITGKTYLPYQVFERCIGREKIRIIAIDSCLFLDEKASQNNLSIVWSELEKVTNQIRNDEYINILMMHHGLECFDPESRVQLKRWIENNYIDIIFCGHSIINEVTPYISVQNQVQQFSSTMVPLDENVFPDFWICQYEANTAIVEMKLYTYDYYGRIQKSCLWKGDPYYYQLFRKRKNCFVNKLNSIFSETMVPTHRDNAISNLIIQSKMQETLYKLEAALDTIIDDLSNKQEIIEHRQEKNLENDIRDSKPDNKVFIVHGHDEGTTETVARFLEQCGFETIILNEMVDGGKTNIEKIEQYTDVAYAIVLYTPCDIGRNKNEKRSRPRAGQDVLFEHGYLIGKLGREHVCALVKENVEIPEDISGATCKVMDLAGAWKTEVLREMKNAGIAIDASKLL